VTNEIQAFLKSCGFQTIRSGTGVNGVMAVIRLGFHSCRHTFVSTCLEQGVSDYVIRGIVGNSYRLYEHISMASLQNAVNKLDVLANHRDGAAADAKTPEIAWQLLSNDQVMAIIESGLREISTRNGGHEGPVSQRQPVHSVHS
jgi:hypothetical protein